MIEARNVVKTYQTGRVGLEVLRGVSLQIDPDAFIAIMGPSGAGKSTLLHLLAGLDTPTQGEVFWEKEAISRLSDAQRAAFRNQKLGVVFQFYHLLPELTALENVLLPGLIGGRSGKPLRRVAADCLERVGLKERLRHRPGELSGGERQRVAIARALVNDPALLLCDEPTGNLDSHTGEEIIELLMSLHSRQKQGLVVVTHHVTHHVKLAERAEKVIVLEDGRIVQERSSK
ncbi:MAG: ABC transporter ATP-binding protein [Candidatus Omnitrophica bacterium]|nr:ABC transporter ATP-binding protein [Candidatus Omnitrophota bacterium]